jgi:hypothetical protein
MRSATLSGTGTALTLFLSDGRVEVGSNTSGRCVRSPSARDVNLFAGSEFLLTTGKLYGVDPLTWLTEVPERIAAGRTKNHQLPPIVATPTKVWKAHCSAAPPLRRPAVPRITSDKRNFWTENVCSSLPSMTDSAALDPSATRGAPLAGPETGSPDHPGAGPGPDRAPAGPTAPAAPPRSPISPAARQSTPPAPAAPAPAVPIARPGTSTRHGAPALVARRRLGRHRHARRALCRSGSCRQRDPRALDSHRNRAPARRSFPGSAPPRLAMVIEGATRAKGVHPPSLGNTLSPSLPPPAPLSSPQKKIYPTMGTA